MYIDAQLNALRELQMQPAFIAGRQAVRNKDRQSGLWTQNYMSWCHRIIEIFKSFCRMMFPAKRLLSGLFTVHLGHKF
jgi:hypothetical protein